MSVFKSARIAPRRDIPSTATAGIHLVDGSDADVIFGGLAGTNSGTIGKCQINVTVTINSATDTVFGGLVGTNSGTITDSCANVSITYSGSADVVTIGGLVGRMDSGNLQDCTAEGAITKSGTVSTAIIGGAVGAENADSTSAGYTNVTSTVHVDTDWANADKTVDTPCETPAGQGPVGTFIGYVNDGTFTGCSTADHQNTAFHFLGEAHLDTGNFTKDVWSADKLYSGGFTSYQESGKYTIVNADGASLTEQDSYIYVPAQLSGCTFQLGGATYNQVIGTDNYHYQLASEKTLNIYSATKLTAGFGRAKKDFSYRSLVGSLSNISGTYTVEDTGYYYKKDSSYYKVSVTYTVTVEYNRGHKRTYYVFELFGYTNDGTQVVPLDTSGKISSSEISRKYLYNIYDAPTVSSPTSGQEYALVTSDGAYALGYRGAPLTWSGSFRQHETLGQQVLSLIHI